jgi:class 3 adenylate cyclase/tetratricopeptide (TPR) repeat protein
MSTCPSCGRELTGDFRFCPYCAAPLTESHAERPREERKVVTVLFCDLVGFTSRAEQLDPEDVRAFLAPFHARLRSELERFGGTVEKFIGDAVMAVFGAPIAHEDDPERAVRSALAIRDWADEEGIELRIGVNTGVALVAIGADPLAAGDVVNTAARLEAAAPTGGILVGEATYRATRDVIDYRDHGLAEAKGKAAPVPVWAAVEARSRVKVERGARVELVGRRRELLLLSETLDRALSEREPQLVTLSGVPGIGKSRLVYELFRMIEQRPELVYWRHGRSLPYGDGVAFWALSEIVKAHAGILETDSAAQADEKLRAAVTGVAGEEDPRWLAQYLRPLVGLEVGAAVGDHRTEAFTAWRRFLESLAEDGPTVLVFEDLHWADEALLDFVDHLVDWASGVPLFVLATARPELLERRPGWGGGKPNATTISLSPLSDDETTKLVHALLERPVLPAETQAALLARAGGNPLYAEEFARLVAEGRPPDELPEGVQGLIAARLDSLPEDEKTLLQDAAVVGRTFWLGSASAIGSTTRWAAEERLHALERKEFVRRERRSSVAGETEYAFRHLLVRDVAYGQIPRSERAARHRLAAEWIESLGRAEDHAEMLAHHYLSALELARASGGDDESLVARARAAARDAGDRAFGLNAFPAAARLYSQALSLSQPDDSDREDRPELRFLLARSLHLAADERAEEALEDASRELQAARRPERAAEAHVFLTEVWWDRGQRDPAFEHLGRAQALVGEQASPARALVLARAARLQMVAAEPEGAIRAGEEALAIIERFGLEALRVDVLNSVGSARFQLGDPEGLSDLERSIEIGLAIGSHLTAVSYNNLGTMNLYAGDVRRDRELREESRRVAERFGNARQIRFVRGVLVQHDYYAGRWDEALCEADAFIAECEAGAPHYLESSTRVVRALIRLARDEREAATVDALRAEELARDVKDPQSLLPALGCRLRVEFELGRLENAAGLAAALLACTHTAGPIPPGVQMAWTAAPLGIADAVREWIEASGFPSLWDLAALAILDGEFQDAADRFDQIGSRADEAYARLRAGEEGDRTQLERALAFYRSVGALRYIREGEELRATPA